MKKIDQIREEYLKVLKDAKLNVQTFDDSDSVGFGVDLCLVNGTFIDSEVVSSMSIYAGKGEEYLDIYFIELTDGFIIDASFTCYDQDREIERLRKIEPELSFRKRDVTKCMIAYWRKS